MNVAGLVAAAIAALLHVYIFYMEAVAFMQPSIHRRFMVKTTEQAETVRIWAYNQGFYNLFLAAGTFAGVVLFHSHEAVGRSLIVFGCGSMAAAGVVLLTSDRKALRPALIQAVPPLIALVLIW